ncbi:hypothetical protein EVAR_49974_1 [Eumeta japonica]|uniref:Uncharacterized protein n=1 Tax=Eumeta variegata TaxID=151549 RepID=A0A4C1YP56_EUMVA|nr:hypothetical protein EVAR_49974_1 [Eumeta japonica]
MFLASLISFINFAIRLVFNFLSRRVLKGGDQRSRSGASRIDDEPRQFAGELEDRGRCAGERRVVNANAAPLPDFGGGLRRRRRGPRRVRTRTATMYLLFRLWSRDCVPLPPRPGGAGGAP